MLMRQLSGFYAGRLREFPFAVAQRCMNAKPPTMAIPNSPEDIYAEKTAEVVPLKRKRRAKKK